jgi:1-piperideine-2-carboxylate/1-pyrroline-2-carboxylate reductase [NAD(P)H]
MHHPIAVLDAEATAAALPYPALTDALAHAAQDYHLGRIHAPTRQSVDYPNGATLLSMPATAHDIGIHKLVNIMPQNTDINLAVIQGLVCAYDGVNGLPLFVLDGPTVTARRTAAVSMLGIRLLWQNQCRHVAILGAGVQAQGHAQALHALYPHCRISIVARNTQKARALEQTLPHIPLHVASHVPDNADVVIGTTSSSTPVYHHPARADRLLIGMGAYRHDMAEFAADTVRASLHYIDDKISGPHEAGDLIQAQVDWDQVQPIALAQQQAPHPSRPLFYKSIGCAAWDLAAARCARQHLK